ncbi:MAG: urea transporter [Verrucomicrobiae bacterium]|nr:urea transporter [Verrucomicrobiae bacterium]NNJ85816.1 urea transporter [Akkermansiaceae bacterium]
MLTNLALTPVTLPKAEGWAIVITLGIIWVLLGIYWGKKATNSEGFMLAGRKVGLSLGSATAMATWVTSNTTMLAPVFALTLGVWGMLAYSTASFGLLIFAMFAARIRHLLPLGVTAGDFFRLRYGRAGWTVFMLITMLYSLSWLVSMTIAGGDLLQALAGIPYLKGMTLILVVCVLYTLFGGLFAVIGTDFIQSIIILFGIVVIGAIVVMKIDFGEAHEHLATYQPSLLNIAMPAALLAVFNNMLFGFGEVFHNNVWWSRAFAMKRNIAPKAFFLSGVLWFPIPIAAGFIALAAGPLGINIVQENQTGPTVAAAVLGSSGLGNAAGTLILIVLFCSMASSIDSLLAATSDLMIKDVYQGLFRRTISEAQFRWVAGFIILGVGLVAWLLAYPHWPIIEALFISGPLVGSLIWPVIAGLFWEKSNRLLVVAGIVVGSITGVFAYYLLGWFTATLVGAGVSMLFTIASRFIAAVPWKSEPAEIPTNLKL